MKPILAWIICMSLSYAAAAQVRIAGIVKDQQGGHPLAGATIAATGAQRASAVSDANGHFSISLPTTTGFVEVSYVGRTPKRVAYSTGVFLEVFLDEAGSTTMDEVVMIGYGSKRKEDLTTAVSAIQLDDQIKSRPSNLSSMLQGQLPGVTIQSTGGDPLSGSNITIRGMGSRHGDGILYVVDGVPNAPFNVEDIESVAVLKDAASASIYGAFVGSGGVIVITTKKAKAGRVRIDANASTGFQHAWRLPKVLTSEEFNKVVADAAKQDGRPIPFPAADPVKYPYGTQTRTDWLNEIFRVGRINHYALSISGGSEQLKALTSVSYDKNNGILNNTYSELLGAKTNIDFQIAPWLRFAERVSYQYWNGQGGVRANSHEGVLMNAIFYPRSATVYEYDKDGKPVLDSYGDPLYGGTIPRWAAAEGISGFGEIRNPYASLARLRQNNPRHNIFSTSTLEIKPVSNFTLRSDFTAGVRANRSEDFSMRVLEPGLIINDNYRGISSSLYNSWLWENTANYNKKINGLHEISAMAGYTMGKETYRDFGAQVHNYDREGKHFTLLGTGTDWQKTRPWESIWEESTISVLARADYSYKNRYFILGSVRRDASSKLLPANRAQNFYGISGSWKVSSENFFENVRPYINLFKIRASWGQIGNKNTVPLYSYNVPMARTSWPVFFGDNLQTTTYGVYQASIVNRNLIWENSEQSGVGIDIDLFNSLSITVDYFNKLTKDLIEEMPIPSQAGVTIAPYGNIGRVINKGWEIATKYNKTLGEVDFNLFANLTLLNSEVLSLGSRNFIQHTHSVNSIQALRSAVGQPWNSYFLLKTNGVFQTQEEVDSYLWTDANGVKNKIQPNAKPGDLKYVDFNNDGKINADDNQFMGSYLPKVTYAFGTGLKWQGFDLSVFFQGISGVKIFNGFKAMGLTGRQVPSNMLADVLRSWNYDKTSGLPRLGLLSDPNGNFTNPSDFMLEDGSYLRLKNLTVGYSIPKNFLRQIGAEKSNLRFYINGENLLTFTKYTGFDPEIGNLGLDGGGYPISRVISFGLNISL